MEDYHLIQQIGEGSFGRVYKARRKYTGRLVAIKLINKLGQNKDDLVSFRREIEILKKVDHPNIMRLLEIHETETDFAVVSELGRGDLFQVIDDNQTLPEDVLRPIAAQLVHALAYLHDQRIIHRDIKPQNVLIGSDGIVKLCDFGFARALSCTTLVLTSIKGTPLYMAPELVQEKAYNEAIDVWSLGIILYELYFGKPPFYTDSIYNLIRMIVQEPVTWNGQISDEFKSFLNRMLQKDPHQRATCKELLDDPFIRIHYSVSPDDLYRFKSLEFEDCLKESSDFAPASSPLANIQSVFVNPSIHKSEDLIKAVNYLRDTLSPNSPFASSFSFHFTDFLRPEVAEESLQVATALIQEDSSRFLQSFQSAIPTLFSQELPQAAIPFLSQALLIPYANQLIHCEQPTPIEVEKPALLRDRLLSFLFISDPDMIAQTYSLIAFLCKTSDTFLESFADKASSTVMIMVTALKGKVSPLVVTAAFSILQSVISANNSAIQYIVPFSDFLDSLFDVISTVPKNIIELCMVSSAFSFAYDTFSLLVQNNDFMRRVQPKDYSDLIRTTVKSNTIENLILYSSTMPQDTLSLLGYVSVGRSPFTEFPLSDRNVIVCIDRLPYLLPFHVPPLLDSVLSLGSKAVIGNVQKLLPLFSISSCGEKICTFALCHQETFSKLCESGAIPSICSILCESGPAVNECVPLLLATIVLSFDHDSELLRDNCREIVNAIFIADSFLEYGFAIATHLARLSAQNLSQLVQGGALQYAENGLRSDDPKIRALATSLVANIMKHTALAEQFAEVFIPLLVKQLRDRDTDCKRMALLALGNAIFRDPDTASYVTPNSLIEIIEGQDQKAAKLCMQIIGNMGRKLDTATAAMKNGLVYKLITAIDTELCVDALNSISVYCQHEDGRNYLKLKGCTQKLTKLTKNGNTSIKQLALSVVHSLE